MLSKHIVRSFLFALALTATTTFIQNTDVYANPTSVTTCTENALGDQTCTTVTTTTTTTPGTTTGNVLTNSTFGTGTETTESTSVTTDTKTVPTSSKISGETSTANTTKDEINSAHQANTNAQKTDKDQ